MFAGITSACIGGACNPRAHYAGPTLAAGLPKEFQDFRLQALSVGFEIGLIICLLIIGFIASHLATSRYFRQQSKIWF